MALNLCKSVVVGIAVQLLCTAATAQTRYPAERTHSPLTRAVAQRLDGIASIGLAVGRVPDRFIKVGDSITVSPDYFMGQFIHPDHDPIIHDPWDYTRNLGDYEYLRPSMEHFLAGTLAGGGTSFDRSSLAAQSGQTAEWAVTGAPSPLEQEIDAVSPAFAVIMFGTNDIGWWNNDHLVLSWIAEHLFEIVDNCIADGVIPILTAPPLRVDYEEQTHTLSHIIRAIAQARQIPFINYHRSMMPLQNHGLSGDGVHPTTMAYNRSCHVTDEGLEYGYNMRNLVTLQAIDRAMRITVIGTPALDLDSPSLLGDGSTGTPFEVDGLPFIDARTTTPSTLSYRYTFTFSQTTRIRIMATYQGSADADLVLRDPSLTVIGTDDGLIDMELDAGLYFLDVEAASGSTANSGDYQLVIMDRDTTGMPASHGLFLGGVRASPSAVSAGLPVEITFSATALNRNGVITGVALDLSELGGSSSTPMTDIGNGAYTHIEVFPSPEPGERTVVVTAIDDLGNQTSAPVFVLVGDPIFADDFESGTVGAWSAVFP